MFKALLGLVLVGLVVASGAVGHEEGELSPEERVLADEKMQAEQVEINYDHIQTYSTHLKPNLHEEFTIKVADDHRIKGSLDAYIDQDGQYSEATYAKGEEIYLQIFEDGHRLLVQKQFYKTMSFEFTAHKGHKYHLNFITTNTPKAIILIL